MALAPGTRGYTKAIVAAQMLAQIGAFALPALLPGLHRPLGPVENRSGLAGRHFFRRLCRDGPGARRPDRSRAGRGASICSAQA